MNFFVCMVLSFALGLGGFLGTKGNDFWGQEIKKMYGNERAFQGQIIPGTAKQVFPGCLSFTMEWEATNYKIKVRANKWPQDKRPPLGGTVKVRGKLEPIRGFANPGLPSQELRAKIRNEIGSLIVTSENIKIGPAVKDIWYYGALVSSKMQQILRSSMSAGDSALLSGMVLGEKSHISVDVLRAFSATGLIHLLAVSGTHVALLIGFALSVLRKVGLTAKQSIIPIVLFLLGYVLLCGPRPSILRAVIMGLALLAGKAMDREEDAGAVWSGVLLLLLALRPWWILDVGFQLSFLATGGLLWFFSPLKFLLGKYLPAGMAELLGVSLAAQLLMVPVLVYYFHQLSIISPLANMLIIPLLSLVLTMTMSGLLISLIVPVLGKLFLITAAQLLGGALSMIKLMGNMPLATMAVSKLPDILWVIYYLFLGAAFNFWPFSQLISPTRKKILLCCVLVFSLGIGIKYLRPQPFSTYFLDVGQGDCALVLTPAGESIMVDTGGLAGNFEVGERIILPVLRYLGVKKLDILILSHGHHDHAGGAAFLAEFVPIGKILVPAGDNSRDLEKLEKIIKKRKIVYKIQKNKTFTLKDCIINIIKASEPDLTIPNSNEQSLLVQINHKGKNLLFTGDAPGKTELAALEERPSLSGDVLKISHHGSSTSSEEVFLRAVAPKAAVISVGHKNKFGHPHQEVLARLENLGIPYLRTDFEGAIKVVFDGEKLSCYSYNKQPKYF